MKKSNRIITAIALVVALTLSCIMVGSAVLAEETQTGSGVVGDTNPAIAVAQKTANSVVGVITYSTQWSRQYGDQRQMIGQGSGVVIAEGYVVTNYHVVEDGNTYQVLLPSGEYADATLTGYDDSTDLAVLKVDSDELVPVAIGSSSELVVGSTVFAIGNPGGTVLANTMTSGIVSALERTSVSADNATRAISYIQHDAAINSGNSGGGLFNVNGELVGINTLKYAGSAFSSVSFEGLGFAIPIDTVYPVAMDIIQYGQVQRPQLGVTVAAQEGPDDARVDYPPASVCVYDVTQDGPADKAGVQPYDFITHVDGVRVTTLQELTTELDKHQAGDTVELTVVRYDNAQSLYSRNNAQSNNANNYGGNYGNYGGNYGNYYGNYGGNYGNYGGNYGYNYPYGYSYNYGSNSSSLPSGQFETLTIQVTLEVLN